MTPPSEIEEYGQRTLSTHELVDRDVTKENLDEMHENSGTLCGGRHVKQDIEIAFIQIFGGNGRKMQFIPSLCESKPDGQVRRSRTYALGSEITRRARVTL